MFTVPSTNRLPGARGPSIIDLGFGLEKSAWAVPGSCSLAGSVLADSEEGPASPLSREAARLPGATRGSVPCGSSPQTGVPGLKRLHHSSSDTLPLSGPTRDFSPGDASRQAFAMGLFDRLKQGLKRTKELLQTDIRDLFKAGEILDAEKLEQFYSRLIRTDMGVAAAREITEELREKYLGRTVVLEDIWKTIRERLQQQLTGATGNTWQADQPLAPLARATSGPTVVLVAGVNGVGKTTSIAKLANLLHKTGHRVVLAAGDTFRAAAVEQLTMWSQRIGCEIVTKPSGSDPAAVAYAGCARALEVNADFVIIDTAGRLQTQQNLMKQLEKVRRVIGDRIPGAPHEVLLVLDATTGQNGVSQARKFSEAVECTGLILAKLDGTAKGGVVVAIRKEMNLPVKYVGVGEQIDDLEVFNPASFAEALCSAG